MKILFLPAYFYPENASSPYLSLTRNQAFADVGIDMLVYTPTPTRNIPDEVYREYKNKRVEVLHDGRMTVRRFRMFREGKNPIMRALRYTLCGIRQMTYGFWVKDADVMLISSTPPIQGAMAAIVKKFRKIPFVYNLQDIFPDSLVGTGLTRKGSLLWKIGRQIEDFTYRNADKIIVISEDFKRNIIAKGVPEKKIEVIYNWVDEKAVVPVSKDQNKLFNQYHLDRSKFYITYCGNIGLTQNMDMLLSVARDFLPFPDLRFVLIGEGTYLNRVNSIISEWQLDNVITLPFQPYEDIAHVFSLGDAGLVISKPNVGENSVPSKTWSIMSAARPVIASFDENELKDIIANNECGLFTKAGDKDAFKRAIMTLYNDREYCSKLGINGRKFILKHLTKASGTSEYIRVMKEVTRLE